MKFISSNVATIARRQRQARRACEACRRRKRRCNHSLNSGINVEDISETPDVAVKTRSSSENRGFGHGNDHSNNADLSSPEAAETTSRPSRRFIGDLNPESVFRSATSPGTATRGLPSQESVGTWLVENLKSSGIPRNPDNHLIRSGSIFSNTSSANQRMVSLLLEEECFSELPPETYLSRLLSFYADEIHPIFPLIDIKFFQSGIDRNSKILLSQAMCMLASMSPQCKDMLYLREGNHLVPPRFFGHRLFCAMRCVIDVGVISNKMVQIQVLGALTLFIEGPECPVIASQLCAKMIQVVHTLGLHIQREHEHEEEYEVTSLCCAWAIDRLNASIHGRPVLMHERDMGRDFDKCIESQAPAFRLLLLVISQLDQVIDLYRPKQSTKPTETELNCPPFEDLVVSAQCTNLQARFLSEY